MSLKTLPQMKQYKPLRIYFLSFLCGVFFCAVLFNIINKTRSNEQNDLILSTIIPTMEVITNYSDEIITPGRININNSSPTELLSLPGIGETKANAIVEFREKYGNFESIDELSFVPGITKDLLESIQELITISNN